MTFMVCITGFMAQGNTVFLGVVRHRAGCDGANMVYKWCFVRFGSFMAFRRQWERQFFHFATCE